jgi:dTDP-glucose 4,6-dehydratase
MDESPLRVLVTGGGGYVAQFVVKQLAQSSPPVSVCVTWSTQPWSPSQATQPPNIQSFQMDVTDAASVKAAFSQFSPQAVVHCAALSSPGTCEKDAALALKVRMMRWQRNAE